MIADDVITAVHEPTDLVNSVVCNIKETPEGNKKIRLCLNPKELNKNIRREHYYTRSIDELLPQLCGKKFFSVVDTKKAYWHVALDHESSLLCTFNFWTVPFQTITLWGQALPGHLPTQTQRGIQRHPKCDGYC